MKYGLTFDMLNSKTGVVSDERADYCGYRTEDGRKP